MSGLRQAGPLGAVLLGVDGDQSGGEADGRRGQDRHRRRHQKPVPPTPASQSHRPGRRGRSRSRRGRCQVHSVGPRRRGPGQRRVRGRFAVSAFV